MKIVKLVIAILVFFVASGCSERGNDIKTTIELYTDGTLDQIEAEIIIEAYNVYVTHVAKINLTRPDFMVCIKTLAEVGLVPGIFADKSSGFSDGVVIQDESSKVVIWRGGCPVSE